MYKHPNVRKTLWSKCLKAIGLQQRSARPYTGVYGQWTMFVRVYGPVEFTPDHKLTIRSPNEA